MRVLSTVQQDVERSFEKAIRAVLIANGYAVDRVAYANNESGYEVAMKAIADSAKKFSVEVFGHGDPQAKDALRVPRIVVTSQGFLPGEVGGDFGAAEYIWDIATSKYKKYEQAAPFSNLRVEVELISSNTSQDRIIEAARQAALANLSFIDKWNDPNTKYMVRYGFTGSRPILSPGLIHKVYTYEIPDLLESNPKLVSSTIAKMTEISIFESSDPDPLLDNGQGELIMKEPSIPATWDNTLLTWDSTTKTFDQTIL